MTEMNEGGSALDYASQGGQFGQRGSATLSQQGFDAATKVGGWLRLVSVLMFISLALGAVGVVVFVFAAIASFISGAQNGVGGGLALLFMAGVYALPLLFTFFLGLYLAHAAGASKRLRSSQSGADLDALLVAMHKYWKLLGILIIVILSLYLLAFLVILLIGGIGAIAGAGAGGTAVPAPRPGF